MAKWDLWFHDYSQWISFFFIENLLSFYLGPYSVSLCSAFLWILFPLAVNGFCFHSLFWGKPSRISVSIEVLFLQWVKRSRSAVKLSQDKTLLTALTLSQSLVCDQLPQPSPRSPQTLLSKRRGELQWCTLKISRWKKALGIPHTLGFCACVKIKWYFPSVKQTNKNYSYTEVWLLLSC